VRYNPPSAVERPIKRCQNEPISQRSGEERESTGSDLECPPGVAGQFYVVAG